MNRFLRLQPGIIKLIFYNKILSASLAQWLEHWSCKPGGESSNLSRGLLAIDFVYRTFWTVDTPYDFFKQLQPDSLLFRLNLMLLVIISINLCFFLNNNQSENLAETNVSMVFFHTFPIIC